MWLLIFLQASAGKGQRYAPRHAVPIPSRLLRARHYSLDRFCDVILACLFLAITLPLIGGCIGRGSGQSLSNERCVRVRW